MAKKLTNVVGVDIGSQKIKIAEIKAKGGVAEITAIGMIDTPAGAVDHTGVYNPDEVGIALKQALSEAGASAKQLVISVAGQASVLVRTIEVPRMNADELKDHMKWEIERNIPFAESNVLSDYKPLADEDPNSPNMDVVFAIAPQSAIDTIVEVARKAKRQPVAIDVEPLGVGRALQANYAQEYEHELVCVVDMGFKTTSINIFKAGKLMQPRQIPVGGEMFTRAIADTFQIDFEEAEKLKIERLRIPQSVIDSVADSGFGGFGFDGGGTQMFGGFGGDDPASSPFLSPETSAFTAAPLPGDAPPYGSPAVDSSLYGVPAVPDVPTYNAPVAEPSPYGVPAVPDMPTYNAPSIHDQSAYGVPNEPVVEPVGLPSANPFEIPGVASDTTMPPVNPFESFDATPVQSGAAAADEDPETLRIFNAVSAVLDEFTAEVRRSIDYFRSRGGEISRIVLCGGGTHLVGLKEYLAKSMAMECGDMDPFKHLGYNQKKIASGYVEDHGSEYAVAIGNGLYAFFE